MGKMCTMLEVSKVPITEKEEENEIELSLELSIGGRYGKSENVREIEGKTIPFEDMISRSDFSRGRDDVGQEEKLERLRINAGGFVEDKQFLKAQQFETRVKDREITEKDGFFEDLARRKRGSELNLGLFSENKSKDKLKKQCLFTKTEYVKNEGRNWAAERSSSAVSDYQSISHKGGSDTGSHSCCLNSLHIEPAQQFGLLVQNPGPTTVQSIIPSQSSKATEKSKPDTWSDHTTNTSSVSEDTFTPKPFDQNRDMASVHRMPCVSTTGNGPNGKTITGFLYKYSKSEVSIMCVCHGSSFTPAEFVEHAGGVDILNPLRHITILPSSFG